MTVQEQYAVLFVGLLFLGMLVCLEIGLRLGRRTKVAEGAKQGLGIIEGAMFTLLGCWWPLRCQVLRSALRGAGT